MAENDNAPGDTWGHHNLKTAADVRRMLQGLPPLTEVPPNSDAPVKGGIIGDSEPIIPPSPALPAGAVSATVETVEEHPLQTTETVEIVDDGSHTVIDDAPKPAPKGKKAN